MNIIPEINTPPGLAGSIYERIRTEQKKSARIRLISTGAVALFSCAGIIPSFIYLLDRFSVSGFYGYASLLFSDGSIVLSQSKELFFSLVESLPLSGIILVLALLGIFIWSASKTTRTARIVLQTA